MLAENKLKERERHISELKKGNALNTLRLGLQAPKIRYFDEVLRSSSTYTPTQIAKELGMSGRELNLRLIACCKHPVPTERNLDAYSTLSEGRIYTDPYAQLAEPQRGNRHGHAYGMDRKGPPVHPPPLQ